MQTMRAIALCRFADSMRGSAFVWGESDCFLLAARCIDAMTDTDAHRQWWQSWRTETEALAAESERLPSQRLRDMGCHDVDVRYVTDGDVLIAPHATFRESCHVVIGRHCLTSTPTHGVGYVRTADVQDVAVLALRVT